MQRRYLGSANFSGKESVDTLVLVGLVLRFWLLFLTD